MDPRTIETSSNTDADDATDEWWPRRTASEYADNSPTKAGSSSDHQMEPYTPVSYGLAKTMEAGLNLKSGGARFDNGSPTKARPHSVASGSKNSPQFARTPPSFEKRTRSGEEPASSYAKSIPASKKPAVREASSPTVPATLPATNMRRLASLTEAYESRKGKMPGDKSLSDIAHTGPSESDRTLGPIRGLAASSSNITTAPSNDLDIEMDEREVEQLADTDTESSVPPTRQNSLMFPAASRTTSMTSVLTDISVPSSSGSRKRSIEHRGEHSSDSVLTTPPKVRRTTDGPPSLPKLSSASTHPNLATKQLYPDLPIDEPSIFRHPPAKSAAADSILCRPPATSSTPSVSSRKTTSIDSTLKIPSQPSVPTSTSISDETTQASPKVLSEMATPDFTFLEALSEANNFFYIAHNRQVQEEMDLRHLSWGVQFEIARGVSQQTWTWEHVTPEKLDKLKGTNVEAAPRVRDVILDRPTLSSRLTNKEHWRELDREQKAILENKGRGIGLMGEWEGKPRWYGGQIQQVARITTANKHSTDPYASFALSLEPLEQRKSNRFARVLGSRRMLQVSIPEDMARGEQSEKLRRFMAQKFVICGRVFVSFHAKDGHVYLMETDQNYERCADMEEGDQHRISLTSFVDWHNPLDLNYKQPISKWATRWALGLSTSVPVIEFLSKDIYYIEDLYAPHDPGEGKPPAEKVMTDGCGFINGAALCLIAQLIGYPHRPTAVQGRIMGAKGMWMLNPHDQAPDEPARIWIRHSQKKINHPSTRDSLTPLERALHVFDLVSISKVSSRIRLSRDSINNLSHNGIPDDVFKSLISVDLEEEVRPLTQWNGPMLPLAKAIGDAGGITGARLQRFAGGTSRAHGFTRGFHCDADDSPVADNAASADFPVSAWLDSFSGAPISLHEAAYEMLAAGFHPMKLPVLADKIHDVLKRVIKAYVKNFKIAISESVEAFILPDPFNVLKEGEIFFRSSQQNLVDPETKALFNTVTGPVIVGRNPLRLPSDLQRVMAIDCPELSNFYDVIIFSTQGKRSLASLLAGGDYDGDTVFMIWSKALVEKFHGSPFCPPPPNFLEEHFEQKAESVVSFGGRVALLPPMDLHSEFQSVLLSGLRDRKIGKYSTLHDNAVFVYGYDHPETLRLAYMVGYCLDSHKLGLDLRENISGRDAKMFNGRRVASMLKEEESGWSNLSPLQNREGDLGPFILDTLIQFGDQLSNQHLVNFDRLLKAVDQRSDYDLLQPHKDATVIASQISDGGYDGYSRGLEAIECHVKKMYIKWTNTTASESQSSSPRRSPTKGRDARKPKGDGWRQVARAYVEGPTDPSTSVIPNVNAVKASFAYAYYKNPKFAFTVAYKDLCAIKASASQNLPITREFGEAMSIVPSFLRVNCIWPYVSGPKTLDIDHIIPNDKVLLIGTRHSPSVMQVAHLVIMDIVG